MQLSDEGTGLVSLEWFVSRCRCFEAVDAYEQVLPFLDSLESVLHLMLVAVDR